MFTDAATAISIQQSSRHNIEAEDELGSEARKPSDNMKHQHQVSGSPVLLRGTVT